MIPHLRQFHAALGDAIDDAVFLVNSSRLPSGQRMTQRFWFADARIDNPPTPDRRKSGSCVEGDLAAFAFAAGQLFGGCEQATGIGRAAEQVGGFLQRLEIFQRKMTTERCFCRVMTTGSWSSQT